MSTLQNKHDMKAILGSLQSKLSLALEVIEKQKELISIYKEKARIGFDYWDADQDSKAGKCLLALAGGNENYYPDLNKTQKEVNEMMERLK